MGGTASDTSLVTISYTDAGGLNIVADNIPKTLKDQLLITHFTVSKAKNKSKIHKKPLSLVTIPEEVQHQKLAGSKITGSKQYRTDKETTTIQWDLTYLRR